MDKETEEILRRGLLETFAGKIKPGLSVRAGFDLTTTDYQGSEGKYHDEWAADFNGGGQELVEDKNGEKGTRVYAGGTLSADALKKLGLSIEEVIGKLILFVNMLEGKTRLSKDAETSEGSWSYAYKVLKSIKEIPVDVGEEEIRYNDQLVFVHFHIISPVK